MVRYIAPGAALWCFCLTAPGSVLGLLLQSKRHHMNLGVQQHFFSSDPDTGTLSTSDTNCHLIWFCLKATALKFYFLTI